MKIDLRSQKHLACKIHATARRNGFSYAKDLGTFPDLLAQGGSYPKMKSRRTELFVCIPHTRWYGLHMFSAQTNMQICLIIYAHSTHTHWIMRIYLDMHTFVYRAYFISKQNKKQKHFLIILSQRMFCLQTKKRSHGPWQSFTINQSKRLSLLFIGICNLLYL